MTGEKGHKLLPEILHTTFLVSNTLIYIVIRPVLRFLTGACTCAFRAMSLLLVVGLMVAGWLTVLLAS